MNFTFDEMVEEPAISSDRSIICGDCLEVMPTLEENSIDSIVTDPPYGLSFMGSEWDYGVPGVAFWKEALRVAKPGAHLLAFGGTRTHHRLAVAIEDAGWEIRDTIGWMYCTGWPKSLNIGEAIDKAAGAEREVGCRTKGGWLSQKTVVDDTAPATAQAKQWDGWGTGLKPAWEPIIIARKPIDKGLTIAENVVKWGTGGINVDGCRVEHNEMPRARTIQAASRGRFPANLIHDGSEEVTRLFPKTGPSKVQPRNQRARCAKSKGAEKARTGIMGHNDNGGSAARFFYCAKASKKDRDEGLEGFEDHFLRRKVGQPDGRKEPGKQTNSYPAKNNHPTVKPTSLMAYLCRLVTPPGGLVLDPFAGSGSTGKACKQEGFRFVGIEMNEEYCKIARARIK